MANMKQIAVVLIPILAMLTGCSRLTYIPIEVAQPPKQELPADIQSLTLINRATDSRFSNHRGDSLQQAYFQKQFRLDTVLLDSKAADTLLIALGNILYESGSFDIVIPEQRTFQHQGVLTLPTSLPYEVADSLTKLYNTDAVLSLDYFRTRVATTYERETLYDSYNSEFLNGYSAGMKIAYDAILRIYDPERRRMLANIMVADTLIWEDIDVEIRPLFSRFTHVKQGLIEAGIEAALQSSGHIAPVWSTANRRYYSKGHPKLVAAHGRIQASDWQGAIRLWQEILDSNPSASLRSMAEFNLAVGYEVTSTLDNAIEWALKSYESRYRPVTYTYLELLNLRKIQLEKR